MNSSDYVRQLDRELRWRFDREDEFLEEVRAHLDDAIARGERDGLRPHEAEALAVQQFGAPVLVAAAHAASRHQIRDRVLFMVAAAIGVAIAWIDSRPNWDDTGVTAGMMLVVATLLGLVAPQRPWRWALLTGIWIPALAMLRAPGVSTLAMLLVLVFPLAGAYLGLAFRRWSLS